MQDRTINNALLALHRQIAQGDGAGLDHVLALMAMRGLSKPRYYQRHPFRRGETVSLVLAQLRTGPKTNPQIGEAVRMARPDLTPRAAANRSYMALLRLEAMGMVRREGRVWTAQQGDVKDEVVSSRDLRLI